MTSAQLKAKRKALRLSQVEAAKAMRVPLRTYQGWEQKRPIPAYVDVLIDCIHVLQTLNEWDAAMEKAERHSAQKIDEFFKRLAPLIEKQQHGRPKKASKT